MVDTHSGASGQPRHREELRIASDAPRGSGIPTNEPRTGAVLGIPHDWRSRGFFPRVKERWWNPADRRLFTPKTFGWGYDNFLGMHVGRPAGRPTPSRWSTR